MSFNSLGLVKKDLIVMKKPLAISAALIILFFVLYYGAVLQNSSLEHLAVIGVILPEILLFMLAPVSVISVSASIDEKQEWNKRERTTPFTRNDSVKAKYILGLLVTVFIIVVPMIILSVIHIIGIISGSQPPVFMPPEILLILIICALLSVIGFSVYIHLMYLVKTNTDFNQVFSVLIGLAASIFIILFWLSASVYMYAGFSETGLFSKNIFVTAVIPILAVPFMILSYKLSCFIFRRTDF
ncbi:MAG: ABC-2 transporter permease [Methanocorpusculum sp.]|nr:ABC-2 transporter permease [Methanocorpusculum sp.]